MSNAETSSQDTENKNGETPPEETVEDGEAAGAGREVLSDRDPREEHPEETLDRLRRLNRLGGGKDKVDAQHDKGKMTARERIEYLFEPGTFQEVDSLVEPVDGAADDGRSSVPGDGVICGFGQINGRRVACYSQDFTVMGGSLSEENGRKICKVMDLAARYGIPLIGINDSGGARIQQGVRSLASYAEIFHRNTKYSGEIPQISLIMGPCAGGAVYSPAICDMVIMVEDTSFMYVTGPDVVKTVTGEELSHTDLGGASVHRKESGVAHMVGENDKHALDLAVQALNFLPDNQAESPSVVETRPPDNSTSLRELVPEDKTRPYDVREVIGGIVDGGSFFELQSDFARNIVVGFARLDGKSIGIVANQPKHNAGTLNIDASDKAARFVRLCDNNNIPIITLEDVPGFLPGKGQETGGIIRHGAKVLYAYSEATVPLITLITRKSYGGAYCVMASKQLEADFNFAWPIAEIAVMGPESAVQVLHGKEIQQADDPQQFQQEKLEEYRRRFGNPWEAARLGYLDDVIKPENTRERLIGALEIALEQDKKRDERRVPHGNIPL